MASRRGWGEDGIYFDHSGECRDPETHRHCPGRWRGVIGIKSGPDGQRRRKKVLGKDKTEVRAKLAELHDDGVFLFPRAVQDANDADQAQAAVEAIARSRQVIAAGHAAAGHPGLWSRIGAVLSGAGYFSKANIEAPGPDRLIGTGARKDPGPHGPGCDHDDPRDQMHHNLSTRQGRDLYRRRAPVPEGGFADLKERAGLRQFAMRGIGKVQGEFLLACAAANIDLLYRRTRLA